MKTPLDKLVYDAARYKDKHIFYEELYKMLYDNELALQYWDPDGSMPVMSLPGATNGDAIIGENIHFMLWGSNKVPVMFTEMPPSIVLHNAQPQPGPVASELCGWLVYSDGPDRFDVISILSTNRNSELPGVQLSFTRKAGEWRGELATTGFINKYLYDDAIGKLSDEDKAVFDVSVYKLCTDILVYLGTYSNYLKQDGKWDTTEPKKARVKLDKHGRVRKFYAIARAGYSNFIPNRV